MNQKLEPVNGFQPLTCALRVRLLRISRKTSESLSLKIPIKVRLLRLKEIIKILDGGECAPRMPQKGKPITSYLLRSHRD